jgi:hypothetical protein
VTFEGAPQFVLHAALAGAGAEFIEGCWYTPGTSSWLDSADFLYSGRSTARFLGFKPDRFVTRETAIDLAMQSFILACEDNLDSKQKRMPVGLGLTAAVASISSPPRRGGHRVHAVVMTPVRTLAVELQLPAAQGEEARGHDGETTSEAAMMLVREALGQQVKAIWHVGDSPVGGDVSQTGFGFYLQPQDVTEEMLRQRLDLRPFFDDGRRLKASCVDRGVHALFPGTFNPVQDAHLAWAGTVDDRLGLQTVLSIDMDPPHKQALSVAQVLERVAMVRMLGWSEGEAPRSIVVTQGAPLYVDKARRFPGVPILMGADAFMRAQDPAWGDPEKVFAEIRALKTRLLVAPRAGYRYPTSGPGMDLVDLISGVEMYDSSTQIREDGLSPLSLS